MKWYIVLLSAGQDNIAQGLPEEVQAGHQEEFLYWRGGQALDQIVQGGHVITLPEGAQKTTGSGT